MLLLLDVPVAGFKPEASAFGVKSSSQCWLSMERNMSAQTVLAQVGLATLLRKSVKRTCGEGYGVLARF